MGTEKEAILILNSDKNNRSTLSRCFSADYEVKAFDKITEALETFEALAIAVVITEIETEESCGIEILRRFREIRLDVPIIVVTACRSISLAVESIKAGAIDFITEPIDQQKLKTLVDEVILQQKILKRKIFLEPVILDQITNVYNKIYFEELLYREMEKANRYSYEFSLLLISVNSHKKNTKKSAPPIGNDILKSAALYLVQKTRTTDFVARYKEDKFIIIATHTPKQGAIILARRIIETVTHEAIPLKDLVSTKLAVSIGIVTFKDDGVRKDTLLRNITKSLHRAESLGKNQACAYEEGI